MVIVLAFCHVKFSRVYPRTLKSFTIFWGCFRRFLADLSVHRQHFIVQPKGRTKEIKETTLECTGAVRSEV